LWRLRANPSGTPLILSQWIEASSLPRDARAIAEMDWVVRLISEVRGVRSEMNVPPASKITLRVIGASHENLDRLETHREQILRLARLEKIEQGGEVPQGAVQIVLDEATLVLPLA